MADDHQPHVPVALEQMLTGLQEIEAVLGDEGKRAVPVVREKLQAAMAARDRGDPVAMLESVGAAMRELAALGDRVDPGEGQLMSALAQRFRGAMLRGDLPEAKKDMQIMFERSGARTKKDE